MSEELKPLTVERLQELINNSIKISQINVTVDLSEIMDSLPPDQSARIAELERQRDELLAAMEQVILELHGGTHEYAQLIAKIKGES